MIKFDEYLNDSIFSISCSANSPEIQNRIKQNDVHLVKSLRKQLHDHSLAFTFIGTENILLAAHDYRVLSYHLDYMNFVVNDNFDAFQNKFTISDIVKAKGLSHMKDTINQIENLGVPLNKILMGLRFGGTEFKNIADANNIFEVMNNDLDYSGFCHLLSSNKTCRWNRSYDVRSSMAISRMDNKETGEIRVIVFDSSRSIANKMRFIMQSNLAGIKTSLIDMDDMRGTCELDLDTFDDFYPFQSASLRASTREDAKFPLLKTINEVIAMFSPKIPKENESAYTSGESHTLSVILIFVSFVIIIIISFIAVARKYWK